MAVLRALRALRAAPALVSRVASVPYDVVDTAEARALAAGNPLSFLHVVRPEIDLPPGTDVHADAVYAQGREGLGRLRAEGAIVADPEPALYLYRQVMDGRAQVGVMGCAAVDEYDADLIKKHEKTRPDKEDDRTRHLLAIGGQTGPVLLTYAASAAIDAIVQRTTSGAALFDFVAQDGIRHTLWTADPADHAAIVSGFEELPALYIADGHHRAASAARARRALAGRGPGEHDRVLAVAFPDDQMQIFPYHRVVKDLNGLTEAQYMEAVGRHARVTEGARDAATNRGHAAMYVGAHWYRLGLNTPTANHDAASALDVSVLQSTVLEPVLGIQDVRTDKRIDFVGGIRGTAELERLVDSGAWAVAFALHPVSVRDLMEIADAGGIMPPKSTWFEPKLRDGLLSHLI